MQKLAVVRCCKSQTA